VYFQAIIDGRKTFELRQNDRSFKAGDILILEEYNPETESYTGRSCTKKVGFIIEGEWGLAEGICCMSLLEQ